MRNEHIKGWLSKAQKEEAEAAKTSATEGTATILGGKGGKETEERREKTPAEMTDWERVMDLVRADCGGGHVAGGSPDPQGEMGLPWHFPCGGDVEGSGGDFKSPAHILHHLPRLPTWILGGSRHRYRHP